MYGKTSLSTTELIWSGIIFWAVVFTACEAPYSFVFKTELKTWQIWSDVIISSIFICDFIYHIRQNYIKKHQTKKNSLAPSNLKEYISLSIDLIACVPFDAVFYFVGLSGATPLKLIRLFRLVRITKIFGLFNSLAIVPKWLKIQMYVVFSMVVIHWIACMGVNWIPQIAGESSYSNYVKAFYWAVTTLTTIGYGDIVPTTDSGRIFTMLVMITGVGVYGLVIGNISRIFSDQSRYKEQTREKMSELSFFMKHYHIPERLQGSVFSYYNHLYTKHLSDNDSKIISELPKALKDELQVYMNMKLVRNLPVFKYCSQPCLKAISASLENLSYAPGDTVIRIGEIGEEMFIIGHGAVEVILNDGNVVASLHEGQFFGEMALLKETTRNADVRAHSYCDLYRLDKSKFVEIIQEFPELLDNMEKVTNKRSSDRRSGHQEKKAS